MYRGHFFSIQSSGIGFSCLRFNQEVNDDNNNNNNNNNIRLLLARRRTTESHDSKAYEDKTLSTVL